jgi:hypothetical protein
LDTCFSPKKRLPSGSNRQHAATQKKAKELSKPWCDNPILENIIQNLGKPPSPVEGVRLTQVKPCRTYLGILVSTFFFWNMFFFGGEQNM